MKKVKIGDLIYNCSLYQERKTLSRGTNIQTYIEFYLDNKYNIDEDIIKENLIKSNNMIIIKIENQIITKDFSNLSYFYYDNQQNLLTFIFFPKEEQ